MKDKILKWLSYGETGASSRAMAFASIDIVASTSHPCDPSDFNRCLLLIEAVPEIKENMYKVAKISDTWQKLVDRWDEVEKCFLDEVGRNWSNSDSAKKTYKLMKQIGC